MSLESFIGADSGAEFSAGDLEKLKEKMQAAAAQMAAAKKQETKQKKKEDELIKILLYFIRSSKKQSLTLLISRVLEKNIPARFILAVILLGNDDVLTEIKHFLGLKAAAQQETARLAAGVTEESSQNPTPDENSLTFFNPNDNGAIPLKIKIEIDNWIKEMLYQAQEHPQKLIDTAYKIEMVPLPKEYEFEDTQYREEKDVYPVLVQLMSEVLRNFLNENGIEQDSEKLYEFSKIIITNILKKIQEDLQNRQLLSN